MNVLSFLRLLADHIKILVIIPLVMIAMVFFLMKDKPKSYTTEASIYTGFASGYSVTSNDRPNWAKINIKFDNFFETIQSRKTRKEISLKLLAFYLAMDTIPKKEMSLKNQADFKMILPPQILEKITVKNDEEEIYERLLKQYDSGHTNEVYLLLNSNHSFFSINQLSNFGGKKMKGSDLVSMYYTTNDAGVCFNTMEIGIKIILKNYRRMKVLESNDVIEYFLRSSEEAKNKLFDIEGQLSDVLDRNNVINYYEQTKFLSSRREDYETANLGEELALSAAKAAMLEAEEKMGQRKEALIKSQKVVELRNELGKISALIAEININKGTPIEESVTSVKNQLNLNKRAVLDSSINNNNRNNDISVEERNNQLTALQKQATNIKKQLREEVEALFNAENSSNGVSTSSILKIWLNAAIAQEESKAKLEQYKLKRVEFDRVYSKFAKLGSYIKKTERRIGVLEQDYLDLLQSLNAARLKQKSIDMETSLEVVVPAYYPVNAEKSKRSLFIVIAGLVGFVLPLGLIMVLEFLDNTIKTPERARDFTALYLSGGFPLLVKKEIPKYEMLYDILINQMVTYINLNYHKGKEQPKPYIVVFYSTRRQEGKTQLSQLIARKLRVSGEKILSINYNSKHDEEYKYLLSHDNPDNIYYKAPSNFSEVLINSHSIIGNKNISDYQYVLLEIPAIIGVDLPFEILKQAHLSLMVIKANRNWNEADTLAMDSYLNSVSHPVSAIINGGHPNSLESIIGEIPKKRSFIRAKIKRFANFQFKANKF